jgi:predicted ATPase
MKLKKLHIENFRSLRNVTWEPGDLNVLIGPNAGGKSNLLKAIEFLAATANGELREHVTQEGGIRPITWNWSANAIAFRAIVSQMESQPKTVENDSVTFDFALKERDKPGDYMVVSESLSIPLPGYGEPRQEILTRDWRTAKIDDGINEIVVGSGDLKADESALQYTSFPRSHGLVSSFARYVGRWSAYQSFRTDPRAPVRQAEVSRRETTLKTNGANLASVLHTLYSDNSTFENDINEAMNAAFGDEFVKLVFSPDAADQRIQLKVRWKSLENPVPSWDLSDGSLRFLFLLVILANPNPPPLVAIDEPETGLHPRMIPIIAEFAADAARRTQVVFATHSPEFLDAITSYEPVTTVVESQNSESTVENISKEQLDHWLKAYTLGELFRTNGLETMK